MEAHEERVRSPWRTAAAAVGAVALVVAAAIASPAPADTPYVVLAWAAVAVGAAVLVVEVGRAPSRPASARGRGLEPRREEIAFPRRAVAEAEDHEVAGPGRQRAAVATSTAAVSASTRSSTSDSSMTKGGPSMTASCTGPLPAG